MIIPDLKSEIINNKKVKFEYYRANELWYKTESGFLFPVPISDIGEATFLAEDKAILFMRYIRQYIDHCKAMIEYDYQKLVISSKGGFEVEKLEESDISLSDIEAEKYFSNR